MKKFLITILPVVVPAAFVLGQEDADSKEEIFELNPFVVDASDDIGYASQNTLAGSRLRTELKDVAAAISAMTAELIEDIGATNLIEASEYAINTRVETDDGRAAGPITDGYTNEFQDFRIRGLPGATRRMNFMPYLGGTDSYNTQRIEINRGPNSILYGIGSAAGVLNVSTKQAETHRTFSNASLRVDSWGGYRASLDTNIPIIEDKFALRVALLHGEEESWRSYGHNDQDRIFLNAKWNISDKTTFTAEYETLDQDRYNPRPAFGVDYISGWDEAGRPTFDNFQGSATPGNPTRDRRAEAVVGVSELSGNPYIVYNPEDGNAQNYRRFVRTDRPADWTNDFARGLSNPEAAMEASWVSGDWENDRYSLTLQHEFMQGLNAEIAYAHQSQESLTTDLGLFGGVMADPNLYKPDGELKDPNNVFFFESKQSRRPQSDELDYLRATLSYEKQLGELGLLRVAGMFESNTLEQKREIQEKFLFNGPEITSGGVFHDSPENSQNRFYQRFYMDESDFDDPNVLMPAPLDFPDGVKVVNPATSLEETYYLHWANRSSGNANWTKSETSSQMLAAQFYTLNNKLVLTGGYREDDEDRFQSQAMRDPNAADGKGVWLLVAPPEEATATFSGDTYTMGGVYHATDKISLFYNHSNSISPPSTARLASIDPSTIDGAASWTAPLRTGVTDDMGIKVSLLDDRLFITATMFQTSAKDDTGFSGFGSSYGNIDDIWLAMSDSGLLSAADKAVADEQYAHVRGIQGYLFDSETEGVELEIVGKLTKAWTISMNFSKTESIRSNMASRYKAYLDYWKDPARGTLSWTNPAYLGLQTAQDTRNDLPEYRTFQDFRDPDDIVARNDFTLNTDTVNERLVEAEKGLYDKVSVYEDRRFIGDNKYNGNIRTRYDFREGALKGLNIGGGVRYRQGRLAGNVIKYDLPADVSGYTDRINGRTINSVTEVEAVDQAILDFNASYKRKLSDKVTWKIQLNINNLLDEDEFIINNVHVSTGAPLTYRYQDPRKFMLTNTFSF